MSDNALNLIKDNDVRWVDLRFTDPRGKEQHTTIPASRVDSDTIEEGIMFDGSSIAGWKSINESDMILMPDDSTPVIDPFRDDTTLNLRCDIVEPSTMQPYERDPRGIATHAAAYLNSTGIGDTAYFGPENEFFVFDDVRWKTEMSGASYHISAEEAAWESNAVVDGGNRGHELRSQEQDFKRFAEEAEEQDAEPPQARHHQEARRSHRTAQHRRVGQRNRTAQPRK